MCPVPVYRLQCAPLATSRLHAFLRCSCCSCAGLGLNARRCCLPVNPCTLRQPCMHATEASSRGCSWQRKACTPLNLAACIHDMMARTWHVTMGRYGCVWEGRATGISSNTLRARVYM